MCSEQFFIKQKLLKDFAEILGDQTVIIIRDNKIYVVKIDDIYLADALKNDTVI
jgi:hypothetical protein